MPRVPQAPGRNVSPAGVPGVRLQAAAPVEAFGGGQSAANVSNQARGLSMDVAQQLDYERQRADEIRLDELRISVNDYENKLKQDAQTKRGKNALGLHEQALESFDQFASEKEHELTSGRQKELFRQAIAARRGHVSNWFLDHEGREMETFRAQEFEASLESSKERVANDPSAVAAELPYMRRTIERRAEDLGLGEEAVKQLVGKHESDAHGRAIRGLLGGHKYAEASKYFAQVRDGMDKELAARLASAVEEGALRVQEFAEVDAMFSGGRPAPGEVADFSGAPKTMAEVIERTKKIENPELRQRVERLARQRLQDMDDAEKAAYAQTLDSAAKAAFESGDVNAIPPDVFKSLNWKDQKAVKLLADQKRRGEEPVTDPEVLTKFMGLSRADVARLSDTDMLTRYRPYMSHSDYEEALEARKSAREGGAKGAQFDSIKGVNEMILDALVQSKLAAIKPDETPGELKGDKAKAFKEFRDEANSAFRAHFNATGKNPSDDEKQAIIDKLALSKSRKVTLELRNWSPGSWLFGSVHKADVKMGDLTPKDLDNAVIEIDWDVRQQLYNIARTGGRTAQGTPFKTWEDANRGRVNRAYIAALNGASDADVQRIILGD